ncbi:MAG TPA: hypothetical protein VII01_16305 [Solirubrobacteraceae bacterium]
MELHPLDQTGVSEPLEAALRRGGRSSRVEMPVDLAGEDVCKGRDQGKDLQIELVRVNVERDRGRPPRASALRSIKVDQLAKAGGWDARQWRRSGCPAGLRARLVRRSAASLGNRRAAAWSKVG